MKSKQFHIRKSQSLQKINITKSFSDKNQLTGIESIDENKQRQKNYFSIINEKRKKSLNEQSKLNSNKSNKLLLIKKKHLSLFENTILYSERKQKNLKFIESRNIQESLSENKKITQNEQKIIISKKQLMNKLNDVKKCLDFGIIQKKQTMKTQIIEIKQQKLPSVKQIKDILQREKIKSQNSNYYSFKDQSHNQSNHYLKKIKRNDTLKNIQQKINLFIENKTQKTLDQFYDKVNFKKEKSQTLKNQLGDKVKNKILKRMNLNPFHTNQFLSLTSRNQIHKSPSNKPKQNLLIPIELSPIMKKQYKKQALIANPNSSFLSKQQQCENIKNDSFLSTITNEQTITNLFPDLQQKQPTVSKQKRSKINMNKIKSKFPVDFFIQKSR